MEVLPNVLLPHGWRWDVLGVETTVAASFVRRYREVEISSVVVGRANNLQGG